MCHADIASSQINQQIALKTIKKLGFSVNAVWNGQECIQYLQEESSEDHPKPDIILMDCQMPIMDGYRATHTIRTENPRYKSIPIVAMTASAIQGDKEKCQQAGMDDYLAKPVKGKSLERMLVKWALEGQRKGENARTFKKRKTSEMNDFTRGQGTNSPRPTATPSRSDTIISKANYSHSEVDRQLNRIEYQSKSLLQRASESENDREVRRALYEQKASSLRDDKLLAVTENPRWPHYGNLEAEKAAVRGNGPSHALTQENIFKLGQQGPQDMLGIRRHSSGSLDGNPQQSTRPSLTSQKMHRSDRTVRPEDGQVR